MKCEFKPDEHEDYLNFLRVMEPVIKELDRLIENSAPSYTGWCRNCGCTTMTVDRTASFGNSINLRESSACKCRLTSRSRLLADVVADEVATGARVALFEQNTPLHAALSKRFVVAGSQFLKMEDRRRASGSNEIAVVLETALTHQDLTSTSYQSESFDAVVHNDILEHIPDYHKALQECHRIIRPNAKVIFTCPFFGYAERTLIRARMVGEDVEHLLPAEIHGDPLSPDGILAFYNFGWDLLHELETIFRIVRLEIRLDRLCGYGSNNHPAFMAGNMLSTTIICQK